MEWMEEAMARWRGLSHERRMTVCASLVHGGDDKARGAAVDLLLAAADEEAERRVPAERKEILFGRGTASLAGVTSETPIEQIARAHEQGKCTECDPSFGCFNGSEPCRKR